MHLTSLKHVLAAVAYGHDDGGHLHLSNLEQLNLARSSLEGFLSAGLAARPALRHLKSR